MRARGESGQGTQVGSSASRVRTLEPIAKNMEQSLIVNESQQEPANEAVS